MPDTDDVRIDKWLWAARFFKTRTLATQAIEGGHVHIDGIRPKPSRSVKIGDVLKIRTPGGEFTVAVLGISANRLGASQAQALYQESEASQAERLRQQSLARLAPVFDHPDTKGRPTKKWRRQLHVFERKNGGGNG